MTKPSTHYTLNAKQQHILKMAYKFRFITAPLLAQYKGLKSRHAMYATIEKLVDQKYLLKRLVKNDSFQNKGGQYALALDGLAYLRGNQRVNQLVLHAMYKNNTVRQEFIDHHVQILKLYLALRHSYPNVFHIFTNTELGDFAYFPVPKPDLYLNRINTSDGSQNEYMLDILDDTQFFILKKRFAVILEHFESGEWEAEAGTAYPTILFVCQDSRAEEKLQSHIAKVLDSMGIDDLRVMTTTITAFKGSTVTIWSDVTEPDLVRSL